MGRSVEQNTLIDYIQRDKPDLRFFSYSFFFIPSSFVLPVRSSFLVVFFIFLIPIFLLDLFLTCFRVILLPLSLISHPPHPSFSLLFLYFSSSCHSSSFCIFTISLSQLLHFFTSICLQLFSLRSLPSLFPFSLNQSLLPPTASHPILLPTHPRAIPLSLSLPSPTISINPPLISSKFPSPYPTH